MNIIANGANNAYDTAHNIIHGKMVSDLACGVRAVPTFFNAVKNNVTTNANSFQQVVKQAPTAALLITGCLALTNPVLVKGALCATAATLFCIAAKDAQKEFNKNFYAEDKPDLDTYDVIEPGTVKKQETSLYQPIDEDWMFVETPENETTGQNQSMQTEEQAPTTVVKLAKESSAQQAANQSPATLVDLAKESSVQQIADKAPATVVDLAEESSVQQTADKAPATVVDLAEESSVQQTADKAPATGSSATTEPTNTGKTSDQNKGFFNTLISWFSFSS